MYVGVRAGGGIGDELEDPAGDPYELYRILFDITFFFFVIVILLAIIQGTHILLFSCHVLQVISKHCLSILKSFLGHWGSGDHAVEPVLQVLLCYFLPNGRRIWTCNIFVFDCLHLVLYHRFHFITCFLWNGVLICDTDRLVM